ncbi:hypothetical protein D9615_009448 [Tricholomella constricta]|uniref:Uncharacterized protein n=1 Tax=Tricholomella constricta TaxID=117010 RepID=A0A8H5LXX1_9AGAR|nr:hypothetical protein D9615_009448 [Tricholomella constricta]
MLAGITYNQPCHAPGRVKPLDNPRGVEGLQDVARWYEERGHGHLRSDVVEAVEPRIGFFGGGGAQRGRESKRTVGNHNDGTIGLAALMNLKAGDRDFDILMEWC